MGGNRADTGFTLLEILVALVVLGFLMVALTQGVQFGLQSWRAQARILTERGDLDVTDRTVRTLIARLDPGSPAEPALVRGDTRSLSFTTELPRAAGALPTRRADVTLTTDAGHRFAMLWVPHIRTWIGPPRVPERADLLTGVDHVEFSYWQKDGTQGAGTWVPTWRGREPPALVRIHVVFPRASRRHWPDIVVAPERERLRP